MNTHLEHAARPLHDLHADSTLPETRQTPLTGSEILSGLFVIKGVGGV